MPLLWEISYNICDIMTQFFSLNEIIASCFCLLLAIFLFFTLYIKYVPGKRRLAILEGPGGPPLWCGPCGCPPACAMAAAVGGCPECYDGDITCTFGDTSVTRGSCGGCQARLGLYEALCAAGSTATEAEITAGMV